MTRNFMGWVSYTFSRSERQDHPARPGTRSRSIRRHILTLLASYKLPRGFQVGARYRYVTGNPTTPIVGAYFDANTDRYMPLNGAPFSARMPAFNQLDLRVDKVWTFDRWRYLDVPGRAERLQRHQPRGDRLQLQLHRRRPGERLAAAADPGPARRLLMATRASSPC